MRRKPPPSDPTRLIAVRFAGCAQSQAKSPFGRIGRRSGIAGARSGRHQATERCLAANAVAFPSKVERRPNWPARRARSLLLAIPLGRLAGKGECVVPDAEVQDGRRSCLARSSGGSRPSGRPSLPPRRCGRRRWRALVKNAALIRLLRLGPDRSEGESTVRRSDNASSKSRSRMSSSGLRSSKPLTHSSECRDRSSESGIRSTHRRIRSSKCRCGSNDRRIRSSERHAITSKRRALESSRGFRQSSRGDRSNHSGAGESSRTGNERESVAGESSRCFRSKRSGGLETRSCIRPSS